MSRDGPTVVPEGNGTKLPWAARLGGDWLRSKQGTARRFKTRAAAEMAYRAALWRHQENVLEAAPLTPDVREVVRTLDRIEGVLGQRAKK